MENSSNIPVSEEKINRKEAIVKVGKYTAFTAAAMMLVLAPIDAVAKKSPPPPRGLQRKKRGL